MNSCRVIAAIATRASQSASPPVAGMVACVFLLAMAGGCAGGKMTPIRDAAEFKEVVLKSDRPVVVDFYKSGCPTCIALDGPMDKLAEEYKGRAIVAKFMLMQATSAVTSPELRDKYNIWNFPTVILFVNGREKWRFLRRYDLDEYRKAINEALAVPTTQRAAMGSGMPSGK